MSFQFILFFLMDLPIFLDGSIYVWMEFLCSIHTKETAQKAWAASISCFVGLLMISCVGAVNLKEWMPCMRTLQNPLYLLTDALKSWRVTWVIRQRSSQEHAVYMSLYTILYMVYDVVYKAHIVAGILSCFSYFGNFEEDNTHVFTSNQAKWKHALVFPCIVLCSLHTAPRACVVCNSLSATVMPATVMPANSCLPGIHVKWTLLCTKSIQALLCFIGICAMLFASFERKVWIEETQHQQGEMPTIILENANLNGELQGICMALCPLGVALASPCTFFIKNNICNSQHPYTSMRSQYIVKGMFACLVFLLLPYRLMFVITDNHVQDMNITVKENVHQIVHVQGVSLCRQWYTWFFFLGSGLMLMKPAYFLPKPLSVEALWPQMEEHEDNSSGTCNPVSFPAKMENMHHAKTSPWHNPSMGWLHETIQDKLVSEIFEQDEEWSSQHACHKVAILLFSNNLQIALHFLVVLLGLGISVLPLVERVVMGFILALCKLTLQSD
jgi:hypothetical protein